MKVLLISYDLKKSDKNYLDLYKTLKKASSWWHYLESCWLLKTSLSPQEWFKKIRPNIDNNDSILIIEVQKHYHGWLPKNAWDWINDNV